MTNVRHFSQQAPVSTETIYSGAGRSAAWTCADAKRLNPGQHCGCSGAADLVRSLAESLVSDCVWFRIGISCPFGALPLLDLAIEPPRLDAPDERKFALALLKSSPDPSL